MMTANGLDVMAYIYKKYGKKPSFEIVGYLAVALTPYCAFSSAYPLYYKVAISAVTILTSFVLTNGAKIWLVKGLKYRLGFDDVFCASFLFIICAYGAIIAFGVDFYFALALFVMLFSSLILGGFTPIFCSLILSFPPSLYNLDLVYFGVLSILSLVIYSFSKYSKLLTAISATVISFGLYSLIITATPLSFNLIILKFLL